MAEPEAAPAADALKNQDLRALRGRALRLCRDAAGPVPPAELAQGVFHRMRPRTPTDIVLLRALLRGDARFSEGRAGWRLVPPAALGLPLEEARFAVVDLEATGSNPERDALLEIGITWVQGLRITGETQRLVHPGRDIPPWISRLTGIDARTVADAPPFADLAREIDEALHGCVFVAHNVDFDYPFLRAQLRAAGREPAAWPRLCTLRLARRFLPQEPSYRLEALAESRGIELDGHHRAPADARATAGLFLQIVAQLRTEREVPTLGDLLALHPQG